MKKIFYLLSLVALCSCQDALEDTSVSIVNNSDVMSFSATVGTPTRAAECQTLDAFQVAAYVNDVTYIPSQVASIDGECSHSFGPSYTLKSIYYWPNGVPVTFYAAATTENGDTILPGKSITGAIPEISADGFHFNWTMGANNWSDQQRDPVVAAKTQSVSWNSETGVTSDDPCVDLTFYHLLSRIGICAYAADTKATANLEFKVTKVVYKGLNDACTFSYTGDITGKYDYTKSTQSPNTLTADYYNPSSDCAYTVSRDDVDYLDKTIHTHESGLSPLAPYSWSNVWPNQQVSSITLTVEVYNKTSKTLIDTQNVTLDAIYDDKGTADTTDDEWIPLSNLDVYQPGYGYLYCVRISLDGDPDDGGDPDPDDPNPDDPGDIKLKAIAICAVVDPWNDTFVGYLGYK